SYVRNNPINATDPHGRGVSVCVEDSDTTKCWNMSDEEYKTLQEAQNRQQGINMPDGKFPSGAITCGGKVCGSAQYFEPPVESHDLVNFALAGLLRGWMSLLGSGGRAAPVTTAPKLTPPEALM